MDDQQQNSEPSEIEKELVETRAKAEENLNGWKRAAADHANFKKEIEKQREETARFAAAAFMSALLPAVDHFGKAMEQKPPDGNADAQFASQWINGLTIVKKEFDAIFAAAGLATIDEADVPFDPSQHEAMMVERGERSGIVLKILEPGYKFHDRVLRPAKVVVSE